jgi:tetratricopeptide (TPR) repeat protein
MIVESSIFPITDIIFEHRVYLPSVGFFLAAAAGTAYLVRSRTVAWALLVTVCLALGGLTIARNNVWSDTLALWQDTARKAPNKDLALANLAGEYMKREMPEKALPLFVRALELKPDFQARTKVYLGKTLQYLNVDVARFTTGEELASYGKGELSSEDRIRLDGITYNNLGLAHEYLGEPAKAREAYRAALRVSPDYDLAWYNLGLLSVRTGDRQQAATAIVQLKKIKPYLAEKLNAAMVQ